MLIKKVEYSRIILIGLVSLVTSFILGLMLVIISLVLPTPSITTLGKVLLTILLIWFTTLWQIPFSLWLSRKRIYTLL